MAAWDAYRRYGEETTSRQTAFRRRYTLLGALYYGSYEADDRWTGLTGPVYESARQVATPVGAIVDFYTQLVWRGDLSTDGKPLPDGTRGAIPIDPQTGQKTTDAQLLRTFSTLFNMWQWRMNMSLIPKTCAIFGDMLVQLEDDPQRGLVMPVMVPPWQVPECDLELDAAGNVKAVAIEYPVTIAASTAFGRDIKAESYTYRKEMDGDSFRFYKDGKPWTDPAGHGNAVQSNPYGFVPACWYRHELVVDSTRGVGAYERTVRQMIDFSAFLSAAEDYQMQKFFAPVGVKGSSLRGGAPVTLPGGATANVSMSEDDLLAARRKRRQQLDLLPLNEQGAFVSLDFDIGQTMDMARFISEALVAENPEATLASKLMGLTQATGPGMQRLLAPIIGKIEQARKSHNTQIIKQLQMATTMIAMRLKGQILPAIPQPVVRLRTDRYDAFQQYDRESFGRGLLDATVPSMPGDIFPESPLEKAQVLTLAANLPDWALREMGFADDVIAAEVASREQKQAALDAAVTGIPSGATGPSGSSGPTGIAQATGARP